MSCNMQKWTGGYSHFPWATENGRRGNLIIVIIIFTCKQSYKRLFFNFNNNMLLYSITHLYLEFIINVYFFIIEIHKHDVYVYQIIIINMLDTCFSVHNNNYVFIKVRPHLSILLADTLEHEQIIVQVQIYLEHAIHTFASK